MTALAWEPAAARADLLAAPVAAALAAMPDPSVVQVVEIDPADADTARLVEISDVQMADCANCILVLGRRGEQERVAACLVLGTTRADVNKTVRKHLDVRKISFMPMDRAVAESSMEYGGITPLGLPDGWPVLVDAAVLQQPHIVIGSGLRRSKLRLPGAAAADLPGAQVIEGMAGPIE